MSGDGGRGVAVSAPDSPSALTVDLLPLESLSLIFSFLNQRHEKHILTISLVSKKFY